MFIRSHGLGKIDAAAYNGNNLQKAKAESSTLLSGLAPLESISVMSQIILRVLLVAAALEYVLPVVSGVSIHKDLTGVLIASLVFNAIFWSLECLLKVIVFGINVGTLGLGAFLTSSLKFLAALLCPSLALIGTAQVLPQSLHIGSYFPGALCAGLALGGTLRVALPAKASRQKKETD